MGQTCKVDRFKDKLDKYSVEDNEAKDDNTEDADNVDDDEESAYEKKRRLQILANRKKIQELRNLFKRKHSNK